MCLGLLHRLPFASANEEVEGTILMKIVTGCSQLGHSVLHSGWFWRISKKS
jgi:hypothetical protein